MRYNPYVSKVELQSKSTRLYKRKPAWLPLTRFSAIVAPCTAGALQVRCSKPAHWHRSHDVLCCGHLKQVSSLHDYAENLYMRRQWQPGYLFPSKTKPENKAKGHGAQLHLLYE